MKVLIREKISPHIFKTPEGYLICQDSVLARTGKQTYRKNELFLDTDDDSEIEVDRPYDEVFSQETLASFENKPVTIEHPDEDVTIDNYKDYSVGFARDIRQGKTENGEDVIIGNLVITDKEAIEKIESGEMKELSCGYDCDITDDANPRQTKIRGNHIALCEQGRAGIAKIIDSVKDKKWEIGNRVRYDGQWWYIVNYSRGCWVLQSEEGAERIQVQDSNIDSVKDAYYGGIEESKLRKSNDFKLKEFFKDLDNEAKKPMSVDRGWEIANIKSKIEKRVKELKNVPNDIYDSVTDETKEEWLKSREPYIYWWYGRVSTDKEYGKPICARIDTTSKKDAKRILEDYCPYITTSDVTIEGKSKTKPNGYEDIHYNIAHWWDSVKDAPNKSDLKVWASAVLKASSERELENIVYEVANYDKALFGKLYKELKGGGSVQYRAKNISDILYWNIQDSIHDDAEYYSNSKKKLEKLYKDFDKASYNEAKEILDEILEIESMSNNKIQHLQERLEAKKGRDSIDDSIQYNREQKSYIKEMCNKYNWDMNVVLKEIEKDYKHKLNFETLDDIIDAVIVWGEDDPARWRKDNIRADKEYVKYMTSLNKDSVDDALESRFIIAEIKRGTPIEKLANKIGTFIIKKISSGKDYDIYRFDGLKEHIQKLITNLQENDIMGRYKYPRGNDSIHDDNNKTIMKYIENDIYEKTLVPTYNNIMARLKYYEKKYGKYKGDIIDDLESRGIQFYDSVDDSVKDSKKLYKVNGKYVSAVHPIDAVKQVRDIGTGGLVEIDNLPTEQKKQCYEWKDKIIKAIQKGYPKVDISIYNFFTFDKKDCTITLTLNLDNAPNDEEWTKHVQEAVEKNNARCFPHPPQPDWVRIYQVKKKVIKDSIHDEAIHYEIEMYGSVRNRTETYQNRENVLNVFKRNFQQAKEWMPISWENGILWKITSKGKQVLYSYSTAYGKAVMKKGAVVSNGWNDSVHDDKNINKGDKVELINVSKKYLGKRGIALGSSLTGEWKIQLEGYNHPIMIRSDKLRKVTDSVHDAKMEYPKEFDALIKKYKDLTIYRTGSKSFEIHTTSRSETFDVYNDKLLDATYPSYVEPYAKWNYVVVEYDDESIEKYNNRKENISTKNKSDTGYIIYNCDERDYGWAQDAGFKMDDIFLSSKNIEWIFSKLTSTKTSSKGKYGYGQYKISGKIEDLKNWLKAMHGCKDNPKIIKD